MLRGLILFFGLLLASCSAPKELPVADNGPKEGQTASGFHYVHYEKGQGPKPQPGQYVRFHLAMLTSDSVLFDSRQQPNMPNVAIPPKDQMPKPASPVLEGLLLMSVGDSLVVRFPLDFQGAPPPAGLEGAGELVYTLVAHEILDAEAFQADRRAAVPANLVQADEQLRAALKTARLETRFRWRQYRTAQLDPFLLTMPSGTAYFPIEIGPGPRPAPGDWVRLHYLGLDMESGDEFFNSYAPKRDLMAQAGEPRFFPALDEAIAQLPAYSTLILFVPPSMGYGPDGLPGKLPPDAPLVVYLQTFPLQAGE